VSRDIPSCLDPQLGKQLEEAGCANLTSKEAARNVGCRVLAAVRAEPACNGVDVDANAAISLLLRREAYEHMIRGIV
jgi:hypothetical protein